MPDFRGRPRLIWVAPETGTQLGSRRDHRNSTNRHSVATVTRGRESRGLIDGLNDIEEDGVRKFFHCKGGKPTKRKPDNRKCEGYSQKVGKENEGQRQVNK